MNVSHLRGFRVFISSIFFISISAVFLDLYNLIPDSFIDYILYFQFLPSIFKFLNVVSISSAGFIFILLITLLFGRVYCSGICPLGFLQDLISRISKRIHKKKTFRKIKDFKVLKYSILLLAILSLSLSSIVFITFLDPFSNFGRIFTDLFKPAIIFINNLLVFILQKFNMYSLYPVELKNFSIIKLLFFYPFPYIHFII